MAKNVKINGVTYENVPQVNIPLSAGSGEATFYDTDDATADASKIRNGETAYGPNGKITGNMTEHNALSGEISTKDGTVTVPAGFHKAAGSVGLSAAEKAKLIAENIKSGVTLFGVPGDSNVVDTSDADAAAAQILKDKYAYVGGQKVKGTMTAATVSQDSTSKVLSIS